MYAQVSRVCKSVHNTKTKTTQRQPKCPSLLNTYHIMDIRQLLKLMKQVTMYAGMERSARYI